MLLEGATMQKNIRHRSKQILRYWATTEFFSPYSIGQLVRRDSSQIIFPDTIAESALPWCNRLPLEEDDSTSPYTAAYFLYLGVFSTEETSDRARHFFSSCPTEWSSTNWQLCGSPATLSCFARLPVGMFGTPLLGGLSLSTLPWAHGHLLQNTITTITLENFWKAVNKMMLNIEKSWLPTLERVVVKKPIELASSLNGGHIEALCRYLFEWARFFPHDYPIAIIEPNGGEERGPIREHPSDPTDLPILNSFYIQDLEAAINMMDEEKEAAIHRYLDQKPTQRTPLDEEKSRQELLNHLRPSQTPAGRWPEENEQSMSCMQQFAINAASNCLQESGIFAINGPPGTGKSTLIKEFIAKNVVERALKLAQFTHASSALHNKRSISFGTDSSVHVRELQPELLGFEMVLASSNNAAVENVSKELPLAAALSADTTAQFLRPVANQLANSEECWGLISAALGNINKCRECIEQLFYKSSDNAHQQNLWEWIDNYDGATFTEAKETFLQLHNQYQKAVSRVEEWLELRDYLQHQSHDCLIAAPLKEQRHLQDVMANVREEIDRLHKKKERCSLTLDSNAEILALWRARKPSWRLRLRKAQEALAWQKKLDALLQARIEQFEELAAYEAEIELLNESLSNLTQKEKAIAAEIDLVTTEYEERLNRYIEMEGDYTMLHLPDENERFDDEAHKRAFYHSPELNAMRSTLFNQALQLHEAWLAEVAQPGGGFRGNVYAISRLLNGKTATVTDDLRVVWHSLFIIIPLISTTFASVGRLFKHLEAKTFGWLLIDEAGQALPQAAVGAIWRTQRVVAIGDPLQIEPITQVAPEILDGMAKQYLGDLELHFSPSQISAPTLADAITPYGTYRDIGNRRFWLGAPLRVHRRCTEPMFTIANTIAYQNHMVLATEPQPLFDCPPSCWFDITGSVSQRQYVPRQGLFLKQALKQFVKLSGSSSFYVITPFKEIAHHIQQALAQDRAFKALIVETGVAKERFNSWLAASVGTIHAFQGKQTDAVFFVLGGDSSTSGALRWASSQPNLLNVAVTRARQRFYVVGSRKLWQRLPYFSIAARHLPVTTELTWSHQLAD